MRIFISILLMLIILGCEKEDISISKIEGLDLYWDHEVFGDEGRRLRFSATSTNEFDSDYELHFNVSIKAETITVNLVQWVGKGKCHFFPMPVMGDDDPYKCHADGGFYLPEKELSNGIYSLKIVTPSFEETSALNITDEKVMLEIPSNEHLKSSIKEVYPIPENVLFGSIVYQGTNNTDAAEEFHNILTNLGLTKTIVPDYPYRYLTVDENGYPNGHWDPDNHSIGFLYDMNNVDFKTIFEQSKIHFDETNLNIFLYTSNGDQGFMDKAEGITAVYAAGD